MRRSIAARPGFTLLELILAIGLTMVLLAAALGFFQQVLRLRASMEDELAHLAAIRALFDRLTMELRVAYHDPGRGIGLSGSETELTLLVTAMPEPIAWLEDEFDARPVGTDLRRITYRLAGSRLERIEQRQVVGTGAIRPATVTPMPEQIGYARFRYWNGQDWQDTWSDGPLPAAVEVRLGREPPPEENNDLENNAGDDADDASYPYHRRVIALASAPPPTGEPVGGEAIDDDEFDFGDDFGDLSNSLSDSRDIRIFTEDLP